MHSDKLSTQDPSWHRRRPLQTELSTAGHAPGFETHMPRGQRKGTSTGHSTAESSATEHWAVVGTQTPSPQRRRPDGQEADDTGHTEAVVAHEPSRHRTPAQLDKPAAESGQVVEHDQVDSQNTSFAVHAVDGGTVVGQSDFLDAQLPSQHLTGRDAGHARSSAEHLASEHTGVPRGHISGLVRHE